MLRFGSRLFAVIVSWQLVVGCGHFPLATVNAAENDEAPDINLVRVASVRRVGQIAQVRPDKIDEFKRMFSEISPEVAQKITGHHIRNYSIWLKQLEPGEHYSFGYFEYTGENLSADLDQMKSDPQLRKWKQAVVGECLAKRSPDDENCWVDMKEVFYFDGAVDEEVDPDDVKRFGHVIGVRPELVDSYSYIHKHAWPEVLDAIKRGKIRNYPIYMTSLGEKVYIFGYFEYVGNDFDADMAQIDADPATKAWIKFTDEVCQLPIATRKEGEWWASMEQVYFQP